MKSANRYRIMTALFCAGLFILTSPRVAIAQSGSTGGSIGNDEKSLSGSRKIAPERPAHKPAAETHRSRPSSGGGGRENFDGPWAFTSTGCPGAGTVVTVISGGRFATQQGSGFVSPSGAIHSAGAGNGLTFTGTGRLVGNSGSGTYERSDGCGGRWTGIRQ
jgi:hypothetical protein